MDIRHIAHVSHAGSLTRNSNNGYAMTFIGGILFGTVGLFTVPMAAFGVSPMMTAFFRMVFASIILAVAVIATKGISAFKVSWRTLAVCVVLGLMFHCLHNICYLTAIVESGVTTSAVLLRIAPIITAFFSTLFFKEAITNRKKMALAVNIIGCVLAVFSMDMFTGGGNIFGIICGIGAGVTFGYLPIIMRFIKEDVDPLVINTYGFLFAAIFLLVVVKPQEHMDMLTMPAIGFGLALALIPTGIGYCIYYKGVSMVTESSKIPVIGSVEVVISALIGLVAFGETLSIVNVIGFIILFISIILISKE